jgi:hypothetical protein
VEASVVAVVVVASEVVVDSIIAPVTDSVSELTIKVPLAVVEIRVETDSDRVGSEVEEEEAVSLVPIVVWGLHGLPWTPIIKAASICFACTIMTNANE